MQAVGHVCTVLESSTARVHNAVQVSGTPEGGLMSDLAGSTDWIELRDNLCAVLGDSQLDHFHHYVVQDAPEDSLKLCAVLGSRAGSLRS